MSKTFTDLRLALKPNTSTQSGLSHIMIPHPQTDAPELSHNSYTILRDTPPEELRWDTIIDRADIENQLLTYNKEAFRAAAASPCGHGIIYDAITFTSLSPRQNSSLLALYHRNGTVTIKF
ncbi:hypothetical protein MHU86_25495 [Fragilaria crotonensis]|nr:hypothetical protein MHU86_25495 [Fragilaria crotonensis]